MFENMDKLVDTFFGNIDKVVANQGNEMSISRLKLLPGRENAYAYLTEDMETAIQGIANLQPTRIHKLYLLRLAVHGPRGLEDEAELFAGIDNPLGLDSLDNALNMAFGGDVLNMGRWFMERLSEVHWSERCECYHDDIVLLDDDEA